ncbi:hypothetical protein [Amycolatopsis magusensis]|uniref:Uncharacterized protein n=1 Tax=Amycolatopsis magusensis TaxID=882444 RepID=A0ABS4PUS1_9PSEU|nr:hypothetical protein [Amycolatopsis magusensis]MBP2182321.1 hypothetical protein [Amycolatopsis magusensis]
MDVLIAAMEDVVFEVFQLTTLFRGQRGTFGGIEVTQGEPALPDQGT